MYHYLNAYFVLTLIHLTVQYMCNNLPVNRIFAQKLKRSNFTKLLFATFAINKNISGAYTSALCNVSQHIMFVFVY